ncbi:MAG: hypothetical protein ACRDKT_02940 [Actinomycetota bacterium]
MRVERPPELWEVDVNDDGALIRVLGESIVAGLVRGNELAELTLNASNVTVPEDAAGDDLPPGDFVGLTIGGAGRWSDMTWARGHAPGDPGPYRDLIVELEKSEASHAYMRDLGTGGSVSVFYRRAGLPEATP